MEPSVKISTSGNVSALFQIKYTYKVFKFSGGEIQIRIDELDQYRKRDIKGAPLTLETNIVSSDILMEVLLLTDALRRMGHNTLTLKTKYFPYARQDRVCYPGEALSLRVVCDIINAQNYEKVIVWDAHSDVTPALLNNVYNVEMWPIVSRVGSIKDFVLVSPDAGAMKKVLKIAQKLDFNMVVAEKVRDPKTGDITSTKVNIPQELVYNNQNFLIVDDICDGGRTFIELAKVLRTYTTGRVELFVTHGIFSNGFADLMNALDHIYTPNYLSSDLAAIDSQFVTVL